MDTKAFTEACALLPNNAAWGDPITPEVVLAIAEAAKDVERERLRGYFLDALADNGIMWPGEVDILYDKCFADERPVPRSA